MKRCGRTLTAVWIRFSRLARRSRCQTSFTAGWRSIRALAAVRPEPGAGSISRITATSSLSPVVGSHRPSSAWPVISATASTPSTSTVSQATWHVRRPRVFLRHWCDMNRSSDDQLPRATSAHSPESAYKGSAICIGLASFRGDIAAEEEPPADALPDLPYAGAVTRDLAAALTDLGFFCAVYTEKELPSTQKLGSCVSGSIASATSEVHVVHVLSHGHPGSAGVYAVAAEGCGDASTW